MAKPVYPQYFLPHACLQQLISALQAQGFTCVGPQVRDDTIIYDVLTDADQLPWGVRDHQSPGGYFLETLPDKKAFSWANGPQAIKPILFKSSETVWRVERNELGQLIFKPYQAEEAPVAIFGARSCDLAAMAIQDKVFTEGQYPDLHYQARRQALFIVAVNCTYASENCFCVSAGTGPEVQNPYDLLMTELDDGFLIQAGSERAEAILNSLKLKKALSDQTDHAIVSIQQAADMQTKRIPFNNQSSLRDLLFANLDHPRWDDVAERCLSCGNCTAVCPTCFCHAEQEKPSLDGLASAHIREWDSCFTEGHSLLGGTPVHGGTRERYRQWLTHKVGSWFDQFGSSGCVGCGRCVTWCPVGIDLTEELAAISGESNIVSELDHD